MLVDAMNGRTTRSVLNPASQAHWQTTFSPGCVQAAGEIAALLKRARRATNCQIRGLLQAPAALGAGKMPP
jgi:hypothetical protein